MGVDSGCHLRDAREEGRRVGHMDCNRLRVAEGAGYSRVAGAGVPAGGHRTGDSPEEVGAEEADIPRRNHHPGCSRLRRNALDRSHRSQTCCDSMVVSDAGL